MPPKKEVKKTKGKQGDKGTKDYLPANCKPPREALAPEDIEVKEVTRTHPLLPQTIFPAWPSNEDIAVFSSIKRF